VFGRCPERAGFHHDRGLRCRGHVHRRRRSVLQRVIARSEASTCAPRCVRRSRGRRVETREGTCSPVPITERLGGRRWWRRSRPRARVTTHRWRASHRCTRRSRRATARELHARHLRVSAGIRLDAPGGWTLVCLEGVGAALKLHWYRARSVAEACGSVRVDDARESLNSAVSFGRMWLGATPSHNESTCPQHPIHSAHISGERNFPIAPAVRRWYQ
jgi:hypothetical protein